MAQTKDATEQFLGSMKGILAIHKKMLPALKDFNKAQEKSLVNQTKMIALMEKTKPIVDTTNATKALTEAMRALGKSSEDTTKKTERVETGLGKFIKNIMRAQDGPAGIIHKMMYGVSGYFIFKNRLDTLLSGIDKFVVRPMSGLKGEDGKQGMIGKMFFGIGGSYRKTQEQLKSVAKGAKGALDLVGEQATHNILGIAEMANPDYKSPLARGKDKFMKSHIIPMADKLSKFEKKALEFYNGNEKRQKIQAKLKEKTKKFASFLGNKGMDMMKKVITFVVFGITVFVMAIKVFTIGFLIMGVIFLIAKLMRSGGMDLQNLQGMGADIMSDIEKYGLQIYEGIMRMKGGFETMWGAIFGDGTLGDLLDGYLEVFLGLWETVKGLALIVLMPLFTLLEETIMTAYEGIKVELAKFYSDQKEAIWQGVFDLGFVLSILAGIGVLIIAAITAFTTMTVAPILLIVLAVVSVVGILLMLVSVIQDIWPFADGGVTKSGMSLVGEGGPELVRLPTGSRVHSNAESKQMMSGGGGNNITVNVQGRIGASDSELRLIAQKVGQMINKEINRTTSSRGLGA